MGFFVVSWKAVYFKVFWIFCEIDPDPVKVWHPYIDEPNLSVSETLLIYICHHGHLNC